MDADENGGGGEGEGQGAYLNGDQQTYFSSPTINHYPDFNY